jgi:hypothetical protein
MYKEREICKLFSQLCLEKKDKTSEKYIYFRKDVFVEGRDV